MKISILKSVDEAVQAKWLAVIIDVFRAFSTEMYIFHNGAKYIIPVQTLEEAYELKKRNPEYILLWERGWLIPEGFDYWNSPTEILNEDFTEKVVVHTTSNWTKWLLLSVNASDVLTWSFLNAAAIIKYIQKENIDDISLISTSHMIQEDNNEDLMLAYYLRDCLEGEETTEESIKEMIKKTSVYSLLFDEIWVPETDFDLCLDFNRFDFVIKQEIRDGKKVLVKVTV